MYDALNANPHLTAYKKDDIPDHFHFKSHYRVAPILLVPQEEWLLIDVSLYHNSSLFLVGQDEQFKMWFFKLG